MNLLALAINENVGLVDFGTTSLRNSKRFILSASPKVGSRLNGLSVWVQLLWSSMLGLLDTNLFSLHYRTVAVMKLVKGAASEVLNVCFRTLQISCSHLHRTSAYRHSRRICSTVST